MIITGLDIETTGLSQEKGHRIVEIAMVCYDSATRQPRLRFVQRINPERNIDAKAQEVHGIALSDLTGKPKWEAVAPKVVAIMQRSALLVAHNGDDFDLPFIVNELLRLDLMPPAHVQTFDTMVNGRWATASGKLPSLKELCFACGVDYDPKKAHAADYDVDVMMESFFKGLDWGRFNIGGVTEKAA